MSQASNRTVSKSRGRALSKHAGTLTVQHRNELPKSDFGFSKSRKYPRPDKSHAVSAKARASQMVKSGKPSASSNAKIDAKANRIILGEGKSHG